MKTFPIVLFSYLAFLEATGQPINNFKLTGKIADRETGYVTLQYLNAGNALIKDTAKIQKGTFVFEGYIQEPTRAVLRGHVKSQSSRDPEHLDFFIEAKSMSVLVSTSNFKNATITGSLAQSELEAYTKAKSSIEKERKKAHEDLKIMSHNASQNASHVDSVDLAKKIKQQQEIKRLYDQKSDSFDIAYSMSHPDSYISPIVVWSLTSKLSSDSLELIFDSWSNVVQHSRTGKIVKNIIKKREDTQIDQLAPDFFARDHMGKDITLSSYRNKKYVLLDFWASWCIPCRKEFPRLTDLYKNYHAKGFEVIAISIDDDKQAWLSSIANDKLDLWKHVRAFQKTYNGHTMDDIIEKYDIPFVPIKLLIDKKGIIIGKWLGESEENSLSLEKKLQEIMKY